MQPTVHAARRGACLALVAAVACALLPAVAFGAPLRYEKAAFDRAVAAGGPVIVHFSAPWCPTCHAQRPLIQQLLLDPSLRSVKFFVADYDRELALRNRLGVAQQATLVVFKSGFEVGRSVGSTDRETLARVFKRAV